MSPTTAPATVKLTEELKREIGQHFIPGFVGQEIGPDSEIVELIRDYYVGAIIIMKRNIRDIPQLRRLIAQLQRTAKDAGHARPLLIGIDQENGLVSAFSKSGPLGGTQFPGAMALGAASSPALTYRVYAATAREMRLAGINWAFAPVCDVNSDPRNPVIGVRSFGDDPQKVSLHAAAAAAGLLAHRIAPAPKHFPGHGDTHVDSHLGLPKIMKGEEELMRGEVVGFLGCITGNVSEAAAGEGEGETSWQKGVRTVPSVMTGHMALPFVTGGDTPSSLSGGITTALLRGRLGYGGVVVTDCLEMDAIADVKSGGVGVERGAVEAVKAGADVVMVCHTGERQRGAVRAVWESVERGEVGEEALRRSGARVEGMKRAFVGEWGDVDVEGAWEGEWENVKKEGEAVAREAFGRCVTVVRDSKGVLPVRVEGGGGVVVFTPAVESLNRAVDDAEYIVRTKDGKVRNTAGPSYNAFAGEIVKRVGGGGGVRHVVYGPGDVPPGDVDLARAVVIFVTRGADRSVWQGEYFRKVMEVRGAGVGARAESDALPATIVLATLTPYEVLEDMEGAPAGTVYMCSWEYTEGALGSAASVVWGEVEARGGMPVKGAKS